MKLVAKLTAFLLLAVCLVLFVYGYLTAIREKAMFEKTVAEDARVIASTLRTAVERVWSTEGDQAALRLIEEVDQHDPKRGFTRLPLDRVNEQDRRHLEAGEEIVRFEPGRLLVMIPLVHPADSVLLFEESLEREEQYVEESVYRIAGASVSVVFACGLLAFLIGYRVVGRPVRELVRKAERVGRGDFSTPVELHQEDEIGVLGGALNSMCEQLSGEIENRERTQRQLWHAERLTTVGRLASGVAHELGTPLNIMLGRASLLASHEDDSVKEQAQGLETEIDRMSGIVRQLLDFTRRGGGDPVELDLRDVVKGSCSMLSPLAKAANVDVSVVVPDTPLGVKGDFEQLHQIVNNLVLNAIQAQEEQGGAIRVEAVAHGAERVVLRVIDQGPGIEPESLELVFEPFYTTKEVGVGTGLGLAVVHGIAQYHGGWAEAGNEPGGGARFSVFLPLSRGAV